MNVPIVKVPLVQVVLEIVGKDHRRVLFNSRIAGILRGDPRITLGQRRRRALLATCLQRPDQCNGRQHKPIATHSRFPFFALGRTNSVAYSSAECRRAKAIVEVSASRQPLFRVPNGNDARIGRSRKSSVTKGGTMKRNLRCDSKADCSQAIQGTTPLCHCQALTGEAQTNKGDRSMFSVGVFPGRQGVWAEKWTSPQTLPLHPVRQMSDNRSASCESPPRRDRLFPDELRQIGSIFGHDRRRPARRRRVSRSVVWAVPLLLGLCRPVAGGNLVAAEGRRLGPGSGDDARGLPRFRAFRGLHREGMAGLARKSWPTTPPISSATIELLRNGPLAAKCPSATRTTALPGAHGAGRPAGHAQPGVSRTRHGTSRHRRIGRTSARLSGGDRSCAIFERLPFDQVAERMGRSRPAVQMLWMRAIRKLQEALEEKEA